MKPTTGASEDQALTVEETVGLLDLIAVAAGQTKALDEITRRLLTIKADNQAADQAKQQLTSVPAEVLREAMVLRSARGMGGLSHG